MLITIDSDASGYWAEVRFKYNPSLVSIIKQMPSRRWDADAKVWIIPYSSIDTLCRFFEMYDSDIGPIMVNGRPWEPAYHGGDTSSSGNPFVALFGALPADLRMKAYKALATVVHPDRGGTTALMQKLNDAKP